MRASTTLLALAATTLVSAVKTIVIDVGQSGLVFTNSSNTADVGDTLEFHFFGSFHTAVQGDFSTPCSMGSLKGKGFNSGPIDNKADGSGEVFRVTVADTDPIWFYCSTPGHCQEGMTGVINPPTSGPNTLDAYTSAAAGTETSEGSTTVTGGVVVAAGSPISGGSSSSSSASVESSSASSVASVSSAATSVAGTSSAPPASTTGTGPASTSAGSTSGSSTGSTTGSATPAAVTTSGGPEVAGRTGRATLLAFMVGLGALVYLMA